MDRSSETSASRYSLSQQVRNHILAKLARGDLAPGDKIVEARIASELHVSAIPVREAIRELAAIRVLDYQVHRGAKVRDVTISETVDALHVKAVLEGLAARLAAGRLKPLLSQLHEFSDKIQDAARQRDWIAYQDWNHHFHRLIVESAGNQILLFVWDSLAFEVRTRHILDVLDAVDARELAMEHDGILDAISVGDAGRVAELLSSHAEDLIDQLLEHRGDGSSPG